ncbi:2Fe-2S iron-sulfur cluster-binding protein [Salisediminibacterium halotolerans]|uniref:Carbon-monoxide dehydrogenase small subunit n=1 Tax=Salisediminibacterium halotolerans TaxID=517425 RepID=A0A1H9T8P8_9BACI|nr:2Fe-2S iron-sulfur cluster-binding protein [Salisediminibacterium haloalkalitolerans]SER92993.1 carbon-monoxide dehydrogenase small subunit [Salisediminibacterium haloalkalitolerans]
MIDLKKTLTKENPLPEAVSFSLNGQWSHFHVAPSRRLVDLLRLDLNMTGTKISCEVGRCGSCMVLMDGKPVNACLVMAYQCEGRAIETIEGLQDEKTDDVQGAFLEEGALQCGYCTPGMIVSLKGLLNENEDPTYDELKQSLSGNICRCTGYGGINRVLVRLSSESATREAGNGGESHQRL